MSALRFSGASTIVVPRQRNTLKNLALGCSWFCARTLLPGGAAEVEPWPRRGMTTREKSQEFMRWISQSSESTNSCRNLHFGRFLLESGESKKKPSILFYGWLLPSGGRETLGDSRDARRPTTHFSLGYFEFLEASEIIVVFSKFTQVKHGNFWLVVSQEQKPQRF